MTSLNDAEISNNATAPNDATGLGGAASSEGGEIVGPSSAEVPSNAEPLSDAEIPNNATGPSDATTPNDATGPNDTTVPINVTSSDDAQIENLKTLFGELLVEFLSVAKSDQPNQTETLRKKLFGLTKGLSRDIGPANPLDYEQKYPKDKPGEELAGNARVWLTYLDEAGAYDRDKIEGWKDTVDVLLVFAGLFSGVITTFISQASQSLQQNYPQVSASLTYETVLLLRAGFSGMPVSDVPMSTLTPTSLFKPSTNAFLVNGLWFTSLAISLATALVAVLTKQWLYYYLSTPPGTAIEKVRIRHFRFEGLEAWKVGLIVDLLPVFLHLALGVFLIGVIIFLFPLDGRIAWAIVAITGITYTLYFISVILPIRYPDCPYTTSLATFAGNVFYFLSAIIHPCCNYFKRRLYFQDLGQRVLYWKKSWHKRISHWKDQLQGNCTTTPTPLPTPTPFYVSIRIQATPGTPPSRMRRKLQRFASRVNRLIGEKVTNWREKNLKKAIQANSGLIELKALEWLRTTSSNPSIRRIVECGLSMHPGPIGKLPWDEMFLGLTQIDDVDDKNHKYTDLQDLRHRLCMDCQHSYWKTVHWGWRSIPSFPEGNVAYHLKKEYQVYSRLSGDITGGKYSKALTTALLERLKLPPHMWRLILHYTSEDRDATAVACVLTSDIRYPFPGRRDNFGTRRVSKWTYETGDVSFEVEQLDKWVFDYLFHFFCHDAQWRLDHLSAFEASYLLFLYIYRDLTSDHPVITDEENRGISLKALFKDFRDSLWGSLWTPQYISPEWPLALFRDISLPVMELNTLASWKIAYLADIETGLLQASGFSCFFMRYPYEDISVVYGRFSRDIHIPMDSVYVIGMILLMPQNRDYLLEKISGDLHPTALSHLCQCLHGLRTLRRYSRAKVWQIEREYIYPNLIHLFRTKHGTGSGRLSKNLYDISVLVEVWKYLAESDELDEKKFLQIIKSRLDPQRSTEFLDKMRQVLGNEYGEDRDKLHESANEFRDILTIRSAPNSTFVSKISDLVSRAVCRRRDVDVEMSAQNNNPIELEQANYPPTSNGNASLNP